jgi:hypothetical protein
MQKKPSLQEQRRDVEKKLYYSDFTEGILPITETETYIIGGHIQSFFKKRLQSV